MASLPVGWRRPALGASIRIELVLMGGFVMRADVLLRLLLEAPLAAHRAEGIRLPFIVHFGCGRVGVDLHAAHRILDHRCHLLSRTVVTRAHDRRIDGLSSTWGDSPAYGRAAEARSARIAAIPSRASAGTEGRPSSRGRTARISASCRAKGKFSSSDGENRPAPSRVQALARYNSASLAARLASGTAWTAIACVPTRSGFSFSSLQPARPRSRRKASWGVRTRASTNSASSSGG